jgi:[acyl-carrier-protein] S-malonyltransferase
MRVASCNVTNKRVEMTKAFVFPGQGSQAAGMGKDLAGAFPQAQAVFAEVDDALGEKLSTLIFEGPEDQLTLTSNTQPALMAVSMAVIRVLEAEAGLDLARDAKFVAGHSLGEYSALAAARTFSLADTARLLRLRGQAMQQAVPVGHGAMAALLGMELEAALEVAAEAAQGEVCQVANDNGGGQVVLSGAKEAVERAAGIARAKGARRAILLPVSAPFHCAMMGPAAEAMQQALAGIAMQAPIVPLVGNVTASPETDPDTIRNNLVTQVTGTVRWRECIACMTSSGVDSFYEIGAGKVLSGIVKRISRDSHSQAIGSPADISAYQNG